MEDNLCTGGLKQTSGIFLLPLFKAFHRSKDFKFKIPIYSLLTIFFSASRYILPQFCNSIEYECILTVSGNVNWVSNKVEIASWDILLLTSANCHYVRWQSLWFMEAVIYDHQRCNLQRVFLASNGISFSAYCSVAPWPIILSWLGYAILSRRRSGAAAASCYPRHHDDYSQLAC